MSRYRDLVDRYPLDPTVVGSSPAMEHAVSVASRVAMSHRDYTHVMQHRRRSIAANLYDGLTSGGMRFWKDVHTLFTNRDITRADLRQLIRRGLAMSGGNYRGLLELFGMEQDDYKARPIRRQPCHTGTRSLGKCWLITCVIALRRKTRGAGGRRSGLLAPALPLIANAYTYTRHL